MSSARCAKMIIAVCGKRRTGKDEICSFLENTAGFKHLKISSGLKEICKILFRFSNSQLETDVKDAIDPRWNLTPRTLMQFIGTEMMQYKLQEVLPDIGRKIWIKSLIENEFHKHDKIVISDLRFLHELDELRKHNAIVVKVLRKTTFDPQVDKHVSENEIELINPDYEIDNNGTLDELRAKLRTFGWN
jgi:dephospho-CoA kinase